MTACNYFGSVPICCLSLRRNMNLRKSRFSSKAKRNSPCRDIKSSIQKGSTKGRKSTKCPSKSSLEKHQKSILENTLVISSSPALNLVTSTPISHEVKKRTSRLSNERAKLKSFNRISSPITSSPIQKASVQTKSCEISLRPVLPRGGQYSGKTNVDQILRSNKKSSNDQSSSLLLNSPIQILYESAHSRRSSKVLRSRNASKRMSNDVKMTLSNKQKPARKVSTTRKHLSCSQKSVEKFVESKKNLHPGNKISSSELSICIEKLPPAISLVYKNTSSVPDEISQTSQDCIQSYNEIDNSKASRYSLRKSSISQERSYSKKKVSTSTKNLMSPSTSENFISDLNRLTRRKSKSHNVDLSQHSHISRLSESNNEIETSKSSRHSLRLQNQHLSKRASGSRYSLRLEEIQLSKESSVNELSQHSSKKTSTKKQKLEKKNRQDKTSKSSKKISNSSKKQSSPKKSADTFQCDFFDLSDTIPIDDLALRFRSPERRKVKSDAFKVPGKNTLKRKRCAIDAIIKADEDYEDDLYESQKFDQFKELLMDTSDSERSFSISTPKFPLTPHIYHKTPRFKDCFSPSEYQISRKAAMEYIYRKNRKSLKKPPEIPVIAEKKKLEYSQVIEDAQKLQKTIESLAEEESDDDDSYFSLN